MTQFSKLVLTEDNKLIETNIRHIPQHFMLQCPNVIMVAEHYDADNKCRCYDKSHTVMKEWGYKWKKGVWK